MPPTRTNFRITLLDMLALTAGLAVGFGYHVRAGVVEPWYPIDWPSRRFWSWDVWLAAPAFFTAPVLLAADYKSNGTRPSWLGWIWLVSSSAWIALCLWGHALGMDGVFTGKLGMPVLGGVALLSLWQILGTPIMIIGLVVMAVSPSWRAAIRWTDLLAIFFMAVLTVNVLYIVMSD